MAKRVRRVPTENKFRLPGPDELNEPPGLLTDYTICLYGTKGIGKSTMAAGCPGNLTFMTEPLRKNLRIRQQPLKVESVERIKEDSDRDAWRIFKEHYIPQIYQDDSVKMVTIDTVDRIYDACLNHHCYNANVVHPGMIEDFGATWGIIREDFEQTLTGIREAGKGLILISHAKETEVELNTGLKQVQYAPSCSPAAGRYLKAACDFAFFYGYHGADRCIHIRNFESVWTGCGTNEHFLDAKTLKPLELVHVPSEDEAWNTLQAAFDNQLTDHQ